MKKGFVIVTGALAFIGLLVMVIITITGNSEGTIITTSEINYFGQWTWKFYKIDIYKYYLNLKASLNPAQLFAIVPSFPKTPAQPTDWSNIPSVLNFVAKILVVFLPNVLVFFINVMLWPIKLLIYPINQMLAIVGINTSDLDMIKAFQTMYKLSIPYIPYW